MELMFHLDPQQLKQRPAHCSPPFLVLYVSILGTAEYRKVGTAQNVSSLLVISKQIIIIVLVKSDPRVH